MPDNHHDENAAIAMDEQHTETVNTVDESSRLPSPPESTALPPPPPQQPLVIPGQRLPYSNAQPVWQFVLLSICTFTFYEFIWWYWNWYLLKEKNRLRINYFGRTIFAPFFAVSFFGQLKRLVGSGYAWSFPPLLCAAFYLVLQLISAVISRANSEVEGGLVLTGVAMLIRYISILALIPAVQALNTFWAAEQPDRPMRTSLSAGAIVTVIIGGLLLLLILLGLIVDITGLA